MKFSVHSLSALNEAFVLQLVLSEGARRSWLLPAMPDQAIGGAEPVAAYELEAGECPAFERGWTWDEGRVAAADEPRESLRRGAMKLHFQGARLFGVYVLIRCAKGQWRLQPTRRSSRMGRLSEKQRALLDRYYRRAGWLGARYFKERPLTFMYATAPGFSDPGTSFLSSPEDFRRLAAENVIELHARNVLRSEPEHPDWLVLDLDPPARRPAKSGQSGAAVLEVARVAQRVFDEMGLKALWKVSGARGLHALIALRGGYETVAVFDFAKMLAEIVVERAPARATIRRAGPARETKVLVDYHRNHHHQTMIAPFSPRFGAGKATLALPVPWSELVQAQTIPSFGLDVSDERLRLAAELLAEASSQASDLELPFVVMERLVEEAL